MQSNRRRFFSWTVGGGAVLGEALPGQAQQPGPESLDSVKFREAVQRGDRAAVIDYLRRDPGLLYARDERGTSVYTLAWLAGKKDLAKELESKGLVLDIFEAALSGNMGRASTLVNAVPGIVHARSIDGRTPLHYATLGGHQPMVMFLNSNGADLSAGPESPMFAVVECSDALASESMAQTLLGNASDPNAKRSDGNTLLHVAAAKGNAAVARMLIHRGADVNAKNGIGKTALDVATAEAVRTLREERDIERVYFRARYRQDLRGGPIERDDTQGLPQILINQFVTAAHRDVDRVKGMLKKCPSLLSTRASFDELAIEAAAHMGLVPLSEYLADQGAPVSICTAVMLGQNEMVRKMLEEDRQRVRERGAHDFPLLAYAAFGRERADIAEVLLRAGANVHAKAFTQTVMHLTAGKGYVDLAAVLLQHGADVNAESPTANGPITPLGVAMRQKQERMIAFLRQRGARA
jgi:ankyrin repeat protein